MKQYFLRLWTDETVFTRLVASAFTAFGVFAQGSPRLKAWFGGPEIPALIAAVGVFMPTGEKNNVNSPVAKALNEATPNEVRAALGTNVIRP